MNKDKDSPNEENDEDSPPTVNLWKDALAKASSKRNIREAHVVICGTNSSGKSTLVNLLRGTVGGEDPKQNKPLFLEYDHIPLPERTGSGGQIVPSGHCNIWQVSEERNVETLATVIPKNALAHVAYVVVLDLSRPHLVEKELARWSEFITKAQDLLMADFSEEEQLVLKDRISSHIQFYNQRQEQGQNPEEEDEKGEGLEMDSNQIREEDIPIQRDTPKVNCGAPIIFVVTKSDAFSRVCATEADTNDKFELLVAHVRNFGLGYGASTFSTWKGQRQLALREYLEHRLFDSPFAQDPSPSITYANLAEESVFVPAGFDAEALINTVLKPAAGGGVPSLAELFPTPKETSKRGRKEVAYRMKATQEDQKFLKELKFEMVNAPNSTKKRVPNDRSRSKITGGANGGDPGKQRKMVGDFFKKLLGSNGSQNHQSSRRNVTNRHHAMGAMKPQ